MVASNCSWNGSTCSILARNSVGTADIYDWKSTMYAHKSSPKCDRKLFLPRWLTTLQCLRSSTAKGNKYLRKSIDISSYFWVTPTRWPGIRYPLKEHKGYFQPVINHRCCYQHQCHCNWKTTSSETTGMPVEYGKLSSRKSQKRSLFPS